MDNKFFKLLLIGGLFFAIISCKEQGKEISEGEVTEKEGAVSGINIEYMDLSVKPGDDFFRYVNGKWLDSTEIPDDRTRWGSFDELRKNTNDDVVEIIDETIKSSSIDSNSDQAKAINLYQTFIDVESRNKMGLEPIKPYLEKVNAIKNVNDLQALLIEMEPYGGIGFYRFSVRADEKDSNKNVVYLNSGQLGLSRDYYVEEDNDSKEKREKYKLHVARMLKFLEYNEADALKIAEQILNLEIRMAKPRLDKVERRDPDKRYNPTPIADLEKKVPIVNWKNYFKELGASKIDTVVIVDVKYFDELQTILSENSVEEWKLYLTWTVLNKFANGLTEELENANWDFYSKTLRGAKKQRPINERALRLVNRSLGEALGKLYVAKKFPEEAKVKAEEMIANVIKAYKIRINALPWMDEATKKKAIEKLNKTTVKVGYPDKWEDYSELDIKSVADGGGYLQNRLNILKWNFNDDIKKLSLPVDKTEWHMAPQVVNAYYSRSYNEIVFPAAILQPPFFNFQADAAVNYGGIGAVIGHEISHGFDDSGADFDADGNLENWWTDKDLKQFNSLGDSLASQYSKIEVLPEVFINGKFTLGENIGDLGGVTAAYDGLQLYLKENGNPELIDSLTAEQRFFISWSTIWRSKMRDEALKNRIKTDSHSPSMNRAVQPLLNIDSFYSAFDIKENDKIYLEPEKRVKIW